MYVLKDILVGRSWQYLWGRNNSHTFFQNNAIWSFVMVGWGLLLFSVWGYTKLISRPVWQGMRMWFNCSWLKVLLPRPTSGESSGWPPPCIIFFGVSSIATKALFIEETKNLVIHQVWFFIRSTGVNGRKTFRNQMSFVRGNPMIRWYSMDERHL